MGRLARRLVAELRYLRALRVLPLRIAWFQWRARRLAIRIGDRFSLDSFTRPHNLARLLALACGRRLVVELGTATGWTSISLALADPQLQVVSYDPYPHPERERYLQLVGASARERITFIAAPGSEGPLDERPVDLLYIDSSHSRPGTIEEIEAWRPVLTFDSVIALDDYGHPEYPGVREAVEELRLSGTAYGPLFVHELRGEQ